MSQRVPWKESNLALIGSDLDHKIKAAAAENEEQWQGLNEAPGKKVWRIEQFKVVPWPEDQYGKFHKGDSYVVLNSYTEDGSDALLHDIHIWIGSESSQDEYGTAAYKMVEADDSLGGAAIQHREVQGKESPLFQSYFEELTYLEGGADTGFNVVEPTKDKPHLYRVKGTEKGMSLTQLSLSKSSLNTGDSFILFANGSNVWLWNGESANPDEKARANSLAESMCTQGTVKVLDQGQGDEEETDFWDYLGDGEIQEADDGDEEVDEFIPLLFKLSDNPDEEPEQVAEGEPVKVRWGSPSPKIDRSFLNENDVFLLDAGWEIFVWIGTDADRSEKLMAMGKADSFCKQDPRKADLPVSIVKSGWESSGFKAFFSE
jgi:gelsolin